MTIVGAFLGGAKQVIPAGSCVVRVQFKTDDGLNIAGARVTATGGPSVYTWDLNATGRVEDIIPSGYTYSLAVTPAGGFYEDIPAQTVVAESKGEYDFVFEGRKILGTLIVNYDIPDANLRVTEDQTGEVKYNGPMTPGPIPIGLASVTLDVTCFGVVKTYRVSVAGDTVLHIDDDVIDVSIADSVRGHVKTLSINGIEAHVPNGPFKSMKVGQATVRIVTTWVWQSGIPVTFDTSADLSKSAVIQVGSSNVFRIDSSRSFTFPATASYEYLMVGGGGGGGGAESGVCSSSYTPDAGSHHYSYEGGVGGGGGGSGYIIGYSERVNGGTVTSAVIGNGGAGGAGGPALKYDPSNKYSQANFGTDGTSGSATTFYGKTANGGAGGKGSDSLGTTWGYGGNGGVGGTGQVSTPLIGISVYIGEGGRGGDGAKAPKPGYPTNPGSDGKEGGPGASGRFDWADPLIGQGGKGGRGGDSSKTSSYNVSNTGGNGGYGGYGIGNYGKGGQGGTGGNTYHNYNPSYERYYAGSSGHAGSRGAVVIRIVSL